MAPPTPLPRACLRCSAPVEPRAAACPRAQARSTPATPCSRGLVCGRAVSIKLAAQRLVIGLRILQLAVFCRDASAYKRVAWAAGHPRCARWGRRADRMQRALGSPDERAACRSASTACMCGGVRRQGRRVLRGQSWPQGIACPAPLKIGTHQTGCAAAGQGRVVRCAHACLTSPPQPSFGQVPRRRGAALTQVCHALCS